MSKYGKNIDDTRLRLEAPHFFVFTKFWRHLWSITGKNHRNMEFISYIVSCKEKLLTKVTKIESKDDGAVAKVGGSLNVHNLVAFVLSM